jgi:hypothetical protein
MSDNAIDSMLLIVGPKTKKKKTVTFHKIEIIELAFAIGDNPSVSDGVPLTLEWVAQKRIVMAVDFFETYRPTRCPTKWHLRINEISRMDILLESGYTQLEIDAAANEAMRIRRLRRISVRQHYRYSSRYDDDETEEEEPPKLEEWKFEYEESNEESLQQEANKQRQRRACEEIVARSAG